jgi:hypothetical protein
MTQSGHPRGSLPNHDNADPMLDFAAVVCPPIMRF